MNIKILKMANNLRYQLQINPMIDFSKEVQSFLTKNVKIKNIAQLIELKNMFELILELAKQSNFTNASIQIQIYIFSTRMLLKAWVVDINELIKTEVQDIIDNYDHLLNFDEISNANDKLNFVIEIIDTYLDTKFNADLFFIQQGLFVLRELKK